MAKPNYNHAKRQKEAARKARQDARLARRQPKRTEDAPAAEGAGNPAAGETREPKP